MEDTELTRARLRILSRALMGAGWELRNFEACAAEHRASVELRRGSLRVDFTVSKRGAQLERFRVDEESVRGAAVLRLAFLGRVKYKDLQTGLRGLSACLADNAGGTLTAEQSHGWMVGENV